MKVKISLGLPVAACCLQPGGSNGNDGTCRRRLGDGRGPGFGHGRRVADGGPDRHACPHPDAHAGPNCDADTNPQPDANSNLDFAQFKRRKQGNRQVGGTERPGLSVYQGRRRTVKNPQTPATGGGAPERWHPRRSATDWRTKPRCDGPRVVVAAEDGLPGWSRRRVPSGLA